MNAEIKKKLLLNALGELNERYSDDGCNDLYPDDPLLKGISKKKLKEIEKEWREKFPQEAEDYDGKMVFNICLIDLLTKEVESN